MTIHAITSLNSKLLSFDDNTISPIKNPMYIIQS